MGPRGNSPVQLQILELHDRIPTLRARAERDRKPGILKTIDFETWIVTPFPRRRYRALKHGIPRATPAREPEQDRISHQPGRLISDDQGTPSQKEQQAGDQVSEQLKQLLHELNAVQDQQEPAPEKQPPHAEPEQIRGPRL